MLSIRTIIGVFALRFGVPAHSFAWSQTLFGTAQAAQLVAVQRNNFLANRIVQWVPFRR